MQERDNSIDNALVLRLALTHRYKETIAGISVSFLMGSAC